MYRIKEFTQGKRKYAVDTTGKILEYRNDTKEYVELIPKLTNFGYLRVKCGLVHRIVATNFIPNPSNFSDVDHINGDKTNNRVENLRWLSHKANCNTITAKNKMSEARKGKSIYSQRSVYQFDASGNIIFCYPSTVSAAEITGVSQGNIYMAAVGLNGIKTAGGFYWSFSPDRENPSSEPRIVKIIEL